MVTARAPHQPPESFATPVFERADLRPGDRGRGPGDHRRARPPRSWSSPAGRPSSPRAITWCCAASSRSPAQAAIGTRSDPIMLEVFNNLFMSIAEQMGVTLQNTAYSVNMKERLDFSCALFDPDGMLIANAPHMPVHLGSMGESVRTILQLRGDSHAAGRRVRAQQPLQRRHPPARRHRGHAGVRRRRAAAVPHRLARPSRRHRRHHAGLDAARQHHDRPGRRADRQFSAGRPGAVSRPRRSRRCSRPGPYPARNPRQNVADLQAQIAACARGAERAARDDRAFRPRDRAGLHQATSRTTPRNRCAACSTCCRHGDFTYPLDNGAQIQVRVDIDRAARRAVVDFTGTSAQLADNFNAPSAVCRAAVLYVFRTLVDSRHPDERGLPEADRDRDPGRLHAQPALSGRGGRRQRRDLAVHHRCALRRARRARGGAGHDEQLHLRQRPATSTTRRSAAAPAPARTSTAPRPCTPT